MKHTKLMLLGLLWLTCQPLFTQTYDPSQYNTGIFNNCDPSGNGGDRLLNLLKNRDIAPTKYQKMTIDEIVNELPQWAPPGEGLPGKKNRVNWDQPSRDIVMEYEKLGVSVVGYLLKITKSGEERCNCKSDEDVDYHLWLGVDPEDDRTNSIIVEISPRTLAQHPSWIKSNIQKLIKGEAKVRVSGWLMYDQEHPEQLNKTKGTLWEIHPIHKIEVWSGGKWREF